MYSSMSTRWKVAILVAIVVAVVFILATLLGVYIPRANSEACVQGLGLQNEIQLLREKLRQSQESFLEMEVQWQSCSNVSRDLNKNLEEVTSKKDSLLSELQKLKGENQNLAEKLRDTEAALQMEREKKNQTSSALLGPQTCSSLLVLGLAITLLL